jgi:hypothetical protein
MSDLLDDLVAATKDSPVLHDEADDTRRRVLAAHRPTIVSSSSSPSSFGLRKRRWSPWVLPLVAAFVATGALAAGPLGQRALAILTSSTSPPPTAATPATPKLPPSAPHATATATDATSEPAPPAPTRLIEGTVEPIRPADTTALAPPPTLPSTAVPVPVPARAGGDGAALSAGPIAERHPARSPVASTAVVNEADHTRTELVPGASVTATERPAMPPAPSSAATDEADALYRAAHDRHFRGGSPAAAVAAWDAYLAKAPRGRFVPEARYNRALALLRAGRKSEGLSALEPFARGAFGGYRKADAQKLLDAAAAMP